MTSLILALIIAALFATLLAYESGDADVKLKFRPAGLLTWLITGNWPAKVGAGLMIIGVGALLRYAFANIDAPPEVKLGGGIVAAAILGFGSVILKSQPKRRAIHLALAGAAFGVAYLTAYSAYGFFNYITDVNALALLALVAMAAGVFAIQSNVMSVAVLAMVGAYLAPKFALGTPGVLPVFGYYLAASILSLVMVTLRGWRPLIHLSFLFTLAGALFFGWSGKFYEPEHYASMQPLLLALAAVHLAMPLLENKFSRAGRIVQFDTVYFVLLPLVAAGLTLKIAPNTRIEGAIGLGELALIWGGAAGILFTRSRPEATRHAIIATLLAAVAALSYFQDIPWLLVGLGFSVTTLVVASRQEGYRKIEGFACGAAGVFGVLHIIQSIVQPPPAHAFLSELFAHRLLAGTLMIFGAIAGIRRGLSFGAILGVIGGGWIALAFIAEIARLNIDYLPQLGYGLLLGTLALYAWLGNRIPASSVIGGVLLFAMIVLAWWAAVGASDTVAAIYLFLTPVVLLALAWSERPAAQKDSTDFISPAALGLLPFALLPWAVAATTTFDAAATFFHAVITMTGVAAAGLAGRFWLNTSARWNSQIQYLHVYLTAAVLLWVTLFHIERGTWPVVFEILALGYLIAYVSRRNRELASVGLIIGAATVFSVALVVQAMLLRGFGPSDPVMTAMDINKMHLPAVASLMWVIFGSGLAWWGTSAKDRTLWGVGAGLLVVAAIKLVFLDFGTLGQLGNIIAFIVAGMVFMGVAWFAPIPPKAEPTPEPAPVPQPISATAVEPPTEQHFDQNPQPTSGQRFDQGAHRTDNSTPKAQPKAGVYRTETLPEPGNIWRWILICGGVILVVFYFAAQNRAERIQKAQENRAKKAASAPAPAEAPAAAPKAPRAPSASAAPSGSATYGTSTLNSHGSSSIQGSQQGQPSIQHGAPAQPADRNAACLNFAKNLPSDFSVIAAGAYNGKATSMKIDKEITVEVNMPGRPVVLMLGAYEPTFWKLSLTPGTNVVAILLSGYHRQTMSGQGGAAEIPHLVSTYDDNGPCGYFYITQDTAPKVNEAAKRIFGRAVDSIHLAIDGRVAIDAASAASTKTSQGINQSREALRDNSAQLGDNSAQRAGIAALEDAIFKGLLRKATAADAEEWSNILRQSFARPSDHRWKPPYQEMRDAYVVLADFTYPGGLYGPPSVTFLIPRGIRLPKGNPGDSIVYDFNRRLRCKANSCERPQ